MARRVVVIQVMKPARKDVVKDVQVADLNKMNPKVFCLTFGFNSHRTHSILFS